MLLTAEEEPTCFCGMDEEWAFGSFTTPDDPSMISFFFQLLILSYEAYRELQMQAKKQYARIVQEPSIFYKS